MSRKKAVWIQRTHMMADDEFICGICGCESPRPYVVCPNCQTKMKGVKYDPNWVDEIETHNIFFGD